MSARGFTLVEVLITLGIFLLVSTVAVVVGLDSYQRVNFRSDVATAAALLQKARSSAMSNVNEASHGVYFDNTAKQFVLFQGNDYASRAPAQDVIIDFSKGVTVTVEEVVFTQLSGAATTDGGIEFSSNGQPVTIEVNADGGINW